MADGESIKFEACYRVIRSCNNCKYYLNLPSTCTKLNLPTEVDAHCRHYERDWDVIKTRGLFHWLKE